MPDQNTPPATGPNAPQNAGAGQNVHTAGAQPATGTTTPGTTTPEQRAASGAPDEKGMDAARAKQLAEGNQLEFQKALDNATPTERKLLEEAKKAHDAETQQQLRQGGQQAAVKQMAQELAQSAAALIAGSFGQGVDPNAITVAGSPGGAFQIRGTGFGDSGTLTVGGKPVQTTSWRSDSIKGVMPADVKSGDEVVITTSGGDKPLRASFGPQRDQQGLRKDGPTRKQFTDAGYDIKNYPPAGYAARD